MEQIAKFKSQILFKRELERRAHGETKENILVYTFELQMRT